MCAVGIQLGTTQMHIAFTKESKSRISLEGASYHSAQKPYLLVCCLHMSNKMVFTVRQILILFRLRLLALPTPSCSSIMFSFTSPPPCRLFALFLFPRLRLIWFTLPLPSLDKALHHLAFTRFVTTSGRNLARENSKEVGQQDKMRVKRYQALQVAYTFNAAIRTTWKFPFLIPILVWNAYDSLKKP